MISKRLGNIVIILVCVIWAANFGAQFIVADYKPDPTINMIFMGIVGGLFALQGRRSGSDTSKEIGRGHEEEDTGGDRR